MLAINFIRDRASLLSCVLALAFVASAVTPQGVTRPAPGPARTSVGAESDDPHVEMTRLMGRVERRLFEIDKLLSKAGAPERGTESLAGRGIDDASGTSVLVRRSQDASRSVVRDIDRILELADHPHPPGAA